jgi:hypothetical protein
MPHIFGLVATKVGTLGPAPSPRNERSLHRAVPDFHPSSIPLEEQARHSSSSLVTVNPHPAKGLSERYIS